jgi:hypothetical protein
MLGRLDFCSVSCFGFGWFGPRVLRSTDWVVGCGIQAEVMAGSPQSTLCGLPASGEDSPNGAASLVSSPPSSPLERTPAHPWDLLLEAAREVALLGTDSIPVPTRNSTANQHRAVVPPAWPPSPPVPEPKAVGFNNYPRNQLQQQIQAARVSSSALDRTGLFFVSCRLASDVVCCCCSSVTP